MNTYLVLGIIIAAVAFFVARIEMYDYFKSQNVDSELEMVIGIILTYLFAAILWPVIILMRVQNIIQKHH